MALFQVPGWTVPTEPVSVSKKRKRPKAPVEDDIASASVNVEKLMRSLDNVLANESKGTGGGKGKGKAKAVILGEDEDTPEPKKRKNAGEAKPKALSAPHAAAGQPPSEKKKKGKWDSEGKPHETTKSARQAAPDLVPPTPAPKGKKKKDAKREKSAPGDVPQVPSRSTAPQPAASQPGMTALQAKMKSSLDGARFRWINEELYKSDSTHAHDMMRKDPKVFDEYHAGFRHQVQSWPTNPVEHYATHLSSYPKKTVIADLGCGDAALAKALVPQGMTVLSFDLVSDSAYVVEADTCSKMPLPGSEGANDAESEGEGQVVDVVVCALSLMGTNWPGTIREAWRVLKSGGELKIAEVASRFTDLDAFVSLVARLGFRLVTKDASNTHFTLFEFRKKARRLIPEKEWKKLLAQGQVLKPCEYKRR